MKVPSRLRPGGACSSLMQVSDWSGHGDDGTYWVVGNDAALVSNLLDLDESVHSWNK